VKSKLPFARRDDTIGEKEFMMLSRRTLVGGIAACGAALAMPNRAWAHAPAKRTIGLGFSLYGMKSLPIAEALKACAEIGYDCVELPVMADWPADSTQLTAHARREILARLADHKLRLSALMENLPAVGDDREHAPRLERLKRACELARELERNGRRPVVETILGGKAGEFESVKPLLVKRLDQWAQVARAAEVIVAIKAHVSNAAQQPRQLRWLLDEIASPWLQAAYDYSHFQLQGLKLAETLRELLPQTVFIHLKDTEHALGKRGFLLPGEGSIDYGEYSRLLAESTYAGDVVVEVSGQVFGQAGYDPLAAARKCYNHLAPAMERGGVSRG
jgi:inosose dehydratase